MNIIFRTDASIHIGTGHVMRCLTLANALRKHGATCEFVCRAHTGNLIDHIESQGFKVHALSVTEQGMHDNSKPDDYAAWLGVPWQQDAEQTLADIQHKKADWLIVDHYGLDAHWERALAATTDRIMVIDDLADRPHYCDLLLDQNMPSDELSERYKSLVPSNCKLLLGPKYAILKPEYPLLSKALPERDGSIYRALVFVGGSDPYHLTELYLSALSDEEFKHLFIDVVVGHNHPSIKTIEELVIQRGRARLYKNLPSLAALMIRADLMLGAGGSTNWERMCLGLNAIVVSVAKNQDEVNEHLNNINAINFLGNVSSLSINKVKTAIRKAICNESGNAAQSKLMRKLVLGEGCSLLVKLISNEAHR